MKTRLQIRPAGAADAALLAELNRWVQELHVERHPELFRSADLSDVTAFFAELLAKPQACAWLAFVEGTAAGYALLIEQQREESAFVRGWRWFELEHLCVHPAWRRRGVARALIETAREHAASCGASQLTASTWAFNEAAQATFRGLGFRPLTQRYHLELGAPAPARAAEPPRGEG